MAIRKLDLFHVLLPLKSKVRHASHVRESSDSLVVRVTLDDGTVGYGEGVPREYVTGENIASTFASLTSFDVAAHFGRPADFEAVVRRAEALVFPETAADPRGMAGNAARCALEVAVLDAFGRRFGRSVGEAVRLVDAPGLKRTARPTRVRYSGAITGSPGFGDWYSSWKMWLFGFSQVKLKVGVDGHDDAARVRTVRGVIGKRVDLRLDANEAWEAAEVVERVRPLLPFAPSALEQPVRHREVGALAEIRRTVGIPLMLDESLCGYPDAERAVREGTADLLNVRLSKCGGLTPALRIIALAQRSGLGVQLGCHPGESALLSAAGRHLASNLRGLSYVEGSYDRYILEHNITAEDPTFGYGGWATPLSGPGLGVSVDLPTLAGATRERKEVCYD